MQETLATNDLTTPIERGALVGFSTSGRLLLLFTLVGLAAWGGSDSEIGTYAESEKAYHDAVVDFMAAYRSLETEPERHALLEDPAREPRQRCPSARARVTRLGLITTAVDLCWSSPRGKNPVERLWRVLKAEKYVAQPVFMITITTGIPAIRVGSF